MERILPLVKKHGAAVIGMANDETGISMVPEERLALARRIIERAADHGIPQEDVIIDPIAMTVAADPTCGLITLETMRLIRDHLGNNMTCGASNVSFGLPDRRDRERRVPAAGDAQWFDMRHHESPGARGAPCRARRRPAAGPRRVRDALDRELPRGRWRQPGPPPNDPAQARGHLRAVPPHDSGAAGDDPLQRGALDRPADRLDVRRARHLRQMQGARIGLPTARRRTAP